MLRFPTAFAALDFETASYDATSVCAIGVVRVERGAIVARQAELVRPPSREFRFTHVHDIRWRDVASMPSFAEAWRSVAPLFEGVELIAAHNASFERRVLTACAERFGVRAPRAPFECTMMLARRTWNLRPTKLSDVAAFLDIPLRHHDPLSDAEASARIVLAVHRGIRCQNLDAWASRTRAR